MGYEWKEHVPLLGPILPMIWLGYASFWLPERR